MKYPFRLKDTVIVDVDQIVSAKIHSGTKMRIFIIFQNAEESIADFNTVEECTQKFEDLCKACTDCALHY